MNLQTWQAWVEGDPEAENRSKSLFAESAAELCAARYMLPDATTIRICVCPVGQPDRTTVIEVTRAYQYSTRPGR